MLITLITLSLAAVGFVWGKIRADVVALIALMVLAVSGIISTQEALSGFSNSIVIMMVGLFVVGGAIFNTGLAKTISARLLKLGGGSETRLFLVVMTGTALIGGFVSNTGTVALMLPIVVSMAAASGSSPRRLLMPLAFASSLGGMLTHRHTAKPCGGRGLGRFFRSHSSPSFQPGQYALWPARCFSFH